MPRTANILDATAALVSAMAAMIHAIRRAVEAHDANPAPGMEFSAKKWREVAIPLLSADLQKLESATSEPTEATNRRNSLAVASDAIHLSKNLDSFRWDFAGADHQEAIAKGVRDVVMAAGDLETVLLRFTPSGSSMTGSLQSLALGSFCLLAASSLIGCNDFSSGNTVLHGTNAAIGGVNLQDSRQPSSVTWDKHLTSCRYDAAGRELVFGGDGKDYLRVAIAPEQQRATLNGPAGSLSYQGSTCSVYKLNLSKQTAPFDGHVSVVCSEHNEDLTGSVRFERCGE